MPLHLLATAVVQVVILGIRTVTPACFLYLGALVVRTFLLGGVEPHPLFDGLVGVALALYAAIEAYFFVHTVRRAARLQARVAGPPFPNAKRWLIFRRVEEASHCVMPMTMPRNCVHWRKFQHLREESRPAQLDESQSAASAAALLTTNPLSNCREGQHPLEFLKGWFHNIPLRLVRHDNLMVFFAEMTFGKHLHELSPLERDELEEVVRYIQLKASLPSSAQQRAAQLARLRQSANVQAQTCSLTPAAFKATSKICVATSPVPSPFPSRSKSRSKSVIASQSPHPRWTPSPTASTSPDTGSSTASFRLTHRGSPSSKRRLSFDVLSPAPSPSSASPSPARSSNNRNNSDDEVEEDDSDDESDCEDDWDRHVSLGTLPPGRADQHDPMALNLAPVQYLHRPLAIYMGVTALGFIAGVYLRWHGFAHHRAGKLTYWYRRAVLTPVEIECETPRADPIVMIHGIGIGVFTYLHMLRELYRTANPGTCGERSMYLIDIPSISMRLGCDDVPTPLEHAEAVAEMLHTHEMQERAYYAQLAKQQQQRAASSTDGEHDASSPSDRSASAFFVTPQPSLDEVQRSAYPIKALIVGHSYGTFVAAWIIKNRPNLVASTVLIDPVCFLVFDPSLIYGFIYRTPFNLVSSIVHFFTSKELGIAHTLCRHFFWYENILWREELERLGMTPTELEASLIAERDQCVASLPYHDLLLEKAHLDSALRSNHSNGNDHCDNLTETSIAEETSDIQPRAKSDGSRTNGHPANGHDANGHCQHHRNDISVPHLKLPAAGTSYADVAASPPAEHPLCPRDSLGRRVHVFLASNDDITPCGSIAAYLEASIEHEERKWGRGRAMLSCHTFPGIGHAEALFHPTMRRTILDTIQQQPSHAQMHKERLQQTMTHAQTPS